MSDNKRQGLLEIGITAVKVLLFVLLIFNALVFILYGFINRGDVIGSESVRFMENWTVEEGNDGSQVLRSTLPQAIKNGEYLFFDTRKDVSVYINGELRKDFVEKEM